MVNFPAKSSYDIVNKQVKSTILEYDEDNPTLEQIQEKIARIKKVKNKRIQTKAISPPEYEEDNPTLKQIQEKIARIKKAEAKRIQSRATSPPEYEVDNPTLK